MGIDLKQRLRNFGWLGADEVVRLGTGFLVTLMLARYLGADGFGAYGYVLGIVALFTPITLSGLDQYVTKHILEDRENVGEVLCTSMALRLPAGLVAAGLAIATMIALPQPAGTSLELVLIASITLLALPLQTPSLFFKAAERPKRIALPRVIVTVATTVAFAVLIALGGGLADFLTLRAGEAVLLGIAAVAMMVPFRRHIGRLRLDPGLFRDLLVTGFPLMLAGIGAVIYMRIDQVMLGQFASIGELGRYTLAVRIADSALFVPMALQAAFFPAIVKAYKSGSTQYQAELKSYFSVMSLAMALVAVGVVIAGGGIIWLFMDPSFARALPMIAILALALPFVGLGVARTSHLTIHGWFWTAPAATALGAAVNVALNLLLIPVYGGTGAAVATVVSYAVAGLGTCFVFPWLNDIGVTMLSSLNPLIAIRTLLSHRRNRPDVPR